MTRTNPAWVVLKFGGTSVSTAANWQRIADILRERTSQSLRPVLVHSALSGVTDQLEALIAAAVVGTQNAALSQIESKHLRLAAELGLQDTARFEAFFAELRFEAEQIAQSRACDDRRRAAVMGTGELMATSLGASFLELRGLPCTWSDAREALKAERRMHATSKASLLSATCDFSPDAQLQARWAALPGIIVTQGFIAADDNGDTVLLGRGGSDTSAAYFAAKLAAERLEIWTDVPGMFSANPRDVPTARLLRNLHYDEAQEIASNGAKVLHPRCILPVRQYKIPLHVYATQAPHLQGTIVSAKVADSAAQVKAIAIKKGITLISMESPGMWHEVGFLADAFAIFKNHGLSVDLISTSETNVTVSLDPAANTLDRAAVQALTASLAELCRVEVLGPCASLSLLGHNIRGILHELGEAFELFQDQKIYLVSQAANDLNFTFVIDETQGDRLVRQLHEKLIQSIGSDDVLGPSWQQLFSAPGDIKPPPERWWNRSGKRDALLAIAAREQAAFVYDGDSLDQAVAALKQVRSIDRWAYAMKANGHPDILRRFHAAGLMIECVSQGELSRCFESIKDLSPQYVIFTPNFAPRSEYEYGFERGVRVTLDNLHPLKRWPEIFRNREVFVRIDPGYGRGHHRHVRTAGVHSKFGIPLFEADELQRLTRAAGVTVRGIHAHTGSGIFDVDNWTDTGAVLAQLAARFTDVRIIDLGGGLGVQEQSSQHALDLAALDRGIASLKLKFTGFEFWMEPGRFLVASAGVLVAQVTQMKGKGDMQYVGIATGMNSLIRPALYAAHHDIVNLSRPDEAATQRYSIVGPICESADVLGHDRWLPPTQEGDVLLIATAGAYGRAMSSSYNLRAPASEFFI